MNNNEMNKEAIQLLNAASSDSDSASDLQFSLAPQPTVQVRRKIRTKRKQRRGETGNGSHSPSLSQLSCSYSNVLKIACISFAVGGTLVLGWIVMLLHTEVQQLSEKLASVPASYDDETILGLKRTIKELTLNQSYHFYVLQNYSRGLEDIRQQMTSMTTDVSNIKDSLKEAPQMLNIGKELDSLKSSLATYGATISDLKLGLAELKELPTAVLETFNSTLQGRLDTISEDLHHHHGMITSLQNTTERLSSQIPAANVPQRMDAVQNALVKLEAQQINTTLTLSYAMELIQQITNGSLGRTK